MDKDLAGENKIYRLMIKYLIGIPLNQKDIVDYYVCKANLFTNRGIGNYVNKDLTARFKKKSEAAWKRLDGVDFELIDFKLIGKTA